MIQLIVKNSKTQESANPTDGEIQLMTKNETQERTNSTDDQKYIKISRHKKALIQLMTKHTQTQEITNSTYDQK